MYLAVGFFAHFDPRDRVAAGLQIRDLGSGILRRAVEHRNRNHRRQSTGVAARVEQIESDLLRECAGRCRSARARDRSMSRSSPFDPGLPYGGRDRRTRRVVPACPDRARESRTRRSCVDRLRRVRRTYSMTRSSRCEGTGRSLARHSASQASPCHRLRQSPGRRGTSPRTPAVGRLIGSSPVQYWTSVLPRERLGPGDAHGRDRQRAREIDRHPLRMPCVIFAGERAREVRDCSSSTSPDRRPSVSSSHSNPCRRCASRHDAAGGIRTNAGSGCRGMCSR